MAPFSFLSASIAFFKKNRIENTTLVIEEIDDSRRYKYRRLSVALELSDPVSLPLSTGRWKYVTPKFGGKALSSRWRSLFKFFFSHSDFFHNTPKQREQLDNGKR